MTTFTKEQLEYWAQTQPIATFALSLMEQLESQELVLSGYSKSSIRKDDRIRELERIATGAKAERDEAERELARAIEEIKQLTAPVEVGGGKTLGYVRYELLDEARRELHEAEEAIRFVSFGDGYDGYRNADDPNRGRVGYTGTQGVWFEYPDRLQPAVRRALARKEGNRE